MPTLKNLAAGVAQWARALALEREDLRGFLVVYLPCLFVCLFVYGLFYVPATISPPSSPFNPSLHSTSVFTPPILSPSASVEERAGLL